MRLHENIDFTTLTWVKPELDETLRQARQALQAYVEEGEDGAQLRACTTYLHQVQGTLRMVELYGAAMVAEEMERLSLALAEGTVAERDAAYAALMRGIVQLPDYLERLQSGHRDVPIVLLPLLNELRECRGEKGLSEVVLFSPDLSRPLPESAKGPDSPLASSELKRRSEVLRNLFQSALLRWLKDDNGPDTVRDLTDVCEQLVPITSAESARRLFWVAAGTLDALARHSFEAAKPLKQALAKVEREIKRLADGGDAAFISEPPLELTKQLLYFVAHAPTDGGRIGEIRKVFGLGDYIPSESELMHARGSMSGRNKALLATVASAIKEDLLRVKDALDLHLRTPDEPAAELGAQLDALDRVADTLGMLGLGVPRRIVLDQRTAIHGIACGEQTADEAVLLDIAGALLYVEASLDDQVARLGDEAAADDAASVGGKSSGLSGIEAQKVLETIVKEAIANFSQARQCYVAFVETHWDHVQLTDVPRLMEEVAGALRILEMPDAPEIIAAVSLFTANELLRRRRVPNGQQMDHLADALAALEYYLEALRDHRAGREKILDRAKQSLAALAYWPLPTAEGAEPVSSSAAPSEVPGFVEADKPTFNDEGAAAAQAEEPRQFEVSGDAGEVGSAPRTAPDVVASDVPVPTASRSEKTKLPPSDAPDRQAGLSRVPGFDVDNQDIDDEIREVFLEEFEEEIANLDQLLPPWRAAPANNELLRPIRRVFHTLKGSGRLVGASALGEFSFKVENMLNRVLDGTRPASPELLRLVEQAFDTLPLLSAALKGELVYADLEGIVAIADRIAAGEDAIYVPVHAAAMPSDEPASADAVSEVSIAQEDATAVELAFEEPRVEVPVADASSPEDHHFVIDPVLFEILKPEVSGHLVSVDAWLADCAMRGPQPVTDPLLRAVHTMNGAFAMTEVITLTEVTSPLEGFIKRSLMHDVTPQSEGVQAVRDAAEAIRQVIIALEGTAPLPVFSALVDRIIALRDALPEARSPLLSSLPDEEASVLSVAVAMDAPDISALPEFVDTHVETTDSVDDEAIAVSEEHAQELLSLDAFLHSSEEQTTDDALGFSLTGAAEEPVESIDLVVEEAQADEVSASLDVSGEDALAAMIAAHAAESEAEPVVSEHAETASEAEVDAEISEATPMIESVAVTSEAEFLSVPELSLLADEPEPAPESETELLEHAERAPSESDDDLNELSASDAAIPVEASLSETIEADEFSEDGDVPSLADTELPVLEQVVEESTDFYGMTLEELEAATAPELPVVASTTEEPPLIVEEDPVALELAEVPVEPEPSEPSVVSAPDDGEPAALALADDPEDDDAPLDMSDIDSELLDIFLEESNDLLDHADGLLTQLRDDFENREPVVGLQRELHTLKGGARMAGVFAVGELGHTMESLLEAIAEGRRELDGTSMKVLERAFDRLHRMVARVGERKAVALPALLIAQLDALARGEDVSQARASDAALRTTMTALDAQEEQGFVATLPVRPPVLGALSVPADVPVEEEDASSVRAPQEQVRIRADLLDRLVNYAGEVAIYRSRLEQQVGSFRSHLSELAQTTTRLRDQLRKLDIETEAQIMARYQREGEAADETFDPLELDRFTTQQQLSRSLAESAADLTSLQGSLEDLTRQYETLLLQQSRVSSDLQEGLMRTRMLPFEALVPRLRRVLRQSAGEVGKQVQLKVDGASGEMDRSVLDHMTAPLEHMLRNAVAHGLETPAERLAAGKLEEGVVRIAVQREGSEVVLRISDDGRGLNRDAIRSKGIERGLITEQDILSDQALYALILESGFSTAESVSRLAGRGVGMDVVNSEIRQLGGTLTIDSVEGKGCLFTVRLPFTLAVTQAVFVKIGDANFAVPIASVQGVGRISRQELDKQRSSDNPSYSYAGESYAIHDLGELIGHAPARAQDSMQMPLLLARSGDLRIALSIDQMLGSKEIVVKPVGPQVSSIPGIFGATVMGDGRVVLILDVAPLVRRQAALARERGASSTVSSAPARRIPAVMVVDDSITMRKVTGRVLERHNMEVLTAKDGIDAIEKMAERVPDLMLLDIEMPRMDGYELAQNMRSDPRLRHVPIIMVTSRTGEKHRQRAMDVGVNGYLGKPYQEAELMRNVFEMLGMEASHD